jgi:uncharacterized oxidoreductase
MPIVTAEILEAMIKGMLVHAGAGEEEAQIVTAHLVDAEACGVISHGIIRVPQYLRALADGQVVAGAQLRILSERPATAVLDGQRGFGQVMAARAMDLAIQRAERVGVGAVSLCNCGHTGRLGCYTERAARRGFAALMMVNAGGHGQWVAPFGGLAGRLSTNPISMAVPAGPAASLVLDIATSMVPEGKVRAMLVAGRTVPEGWVIDHQGLPVTDPAALYAQPHGALLPLGGHKGYGLAMLIDALAGGLSGAGCCTDANAPMAGKTDGVFLMAVNVAAFTPLLEFRQQIGRLVQHVKSCPPAPGHAEVLVPGELEAETRRQRLRDGIPVEAATWDALQQIREQQHGEAQ